MTGAHITARGLQGAVAVVTANLAGLNLSQEELLGDTPPEEALLALSTLVASVLNVTAPSGLATALRAAGRIAGEWEAHQ